MWSPFPSVPTHNCRATPCPTIPGCILVSHVLPTPSCLCGGGVTRSLYGPWEVKARGRADSTQTGWSLTILYLICIIHQSYPVTFSLWRPEANWYCPRANDSVLTVSPREFLTQVLFHAKHVVNRSHDLFFKLIWDNETFDISEFEIKSTNSEIEYKQCWYIRRYTEYKPCYRRDKKTCSSWTN